MKATGCNFSDIYALYMDDGGETKRWTILAGRPGTTRSSRSPTRRA